MKVLLQCMLKRSDTTQRLHCCHIVTMPNLQDCLWPISVPNFTYLRLLRWYFIYCRLLKNKRNFSRPPSSYCVLKSRGIECCQFFQYLLIYLTSGRYSKWHCRRFRFKSSRDCHFVITYLLTYLFTYLLIYLLTYLLN